MKWQEHGNAQTELAPASYPYQEKGHNHVCSQLCCTALQFHQMVVAKMLGPENWRMTLGPTLETKMMVSPTTNKNKRKMTIPTLKKKARAPRTVVKGKRVLPTPTKKKTVLQTVEKTILPTMKRKMTVPRVKRFPVMKRKIQKKKRKRKKRMGPKARTKTRCLTRKKKRKMRCLKMLMGQRQLLPNCFNSGYHHILKQKHHQFLPVSLLLHQQQHSQPWLLRVQPKITILMFP